MKSTLFYIISPCVIAVVIMVFGLLIDTEQGGWRMLGVVAGLPIIAIFAVAAVIARILIRKNNLLLWIAELVLIIVTFLILPNLD